MERNDAMDPVLTMEDLKGKQSVRTTFKLPQQVIDLLTVIAGQLGIKQKSLFDQLVQDASALEQVVQEAKEYSEKDGERRQKTFVMSRNSLALLNSVAEQKEISRDLLVEISIKRLLPIIETEIEKHLKRKTLLKDMKNYLHQGKVLLRKAGDLLGKDDVLYEMIENQVNLAIKNLSAVNQVVKKGMAMENW
ncbi:MAG: hypothetical protein LJE96_04860 [Deltaproteobacteria bacterium]|jgi:hypothetical protein|nr:hypothetical protein [Deltaproteobacteria bacterium]